MTATLDRRKSRVIKQYVLDQLASGRLTHGDCLPSETELARSLGAAAVLTKPFTPAQLLETLRAAILSAHSDRGPAARSA